MDDTTNPTPAGPVPLDKMTPQQQRDAALAALPKMAGNTTDAQPTAHPSHLGEMTNLQHRNAALAALPKMAGNATDAPLYAPTPNFTDPGGGRQLAGSFTPNFKNPGGGR